MRQFLKDYFTFTSSERRGLLTLGILILLAASAPKFYFWIFPPEDISLEDILVSPKRDEGPKTQGKSEDTTVIQLFSFDPNKISEEQWMQLGISEKVTETILNYRESGGKFYDKIDLLKIYGISKEEFLRVEPYIEFDNKQQYDYQSDWKGHWEDEAKSLDINKADSAEWTKLRGIGPVFASRIVNYREMINGFESVEELADVYGIEGEVFEKIEDKLVWDEQTYHELFSRYEKSTSEEGEREKLLDLNSTDSASLTWLSGIGPVYASRIIKYRDLIGGYVHKGQLLEVYGIETELFEKIEPGIRVDTVKIQKIDLNNDKQSDLEAHPYITQAMADFIIRYRLKRPFTKADELLSSYLFDEEKLKRLQPYLKF